MGRLRVRGSRQLCPAGSQPVGYQAGLLCPQPCPGQLQDAVLCSCWCGVLGRLQRHSGIQAWCRQCRAILQSGNVRGHSPGAAHTASSLGGGLRHHFCGLLEWLIGDREALPEWEPGLSSCLSLSFSHDQLSAGALHPPGVVLAAEVLRKPVAGANNKHWLINVSWSQLPAGAGMAGPMSRGILAGAVSRSSVLRDLSSQALQSGPGHGEGRVWGMAGFGAWQRVLSEDRKCKISVTCPLTTFPMEQWQPAAPVTPDLSGGPIQAIVPQFPPKLICGR